MNAKEELIEIDTERVRQEMEGKRLEWRSKIRKNRILAYEINKKKIESKGESLYRVLTLIIYKSARMKSTHSLNLRYYN